MHLKVQKLGYTVKLLLIHVHSKPSRTFTYLEFSSILNFLVWNDLLGQNQAHINSHFDLNNFCQKGCTLKFEKLMFHPVCSLSNLVNLVKAPLGSKFDVRSFEAKNRVFEFDDQ